MSSRIRPVNEAICTSGEPQSLSCRLKSVLSIVVVILVGTYLTSRVDIEEGIRVAEEEDARNSAQNEE